MSTSLHFDTAFSFEKSIHILKAISAHLLGADHDLVNKIEDRNWGYLTNYSCDYSDHRSPSEVKLERQVEAFFSKNASLPLNINRSEVALKKFLDAEEKCRKMNTLLRSSATLEYKTKVDGRLYFEVARKVAEVLGPCPSLDELDFGFGPGANVGLSRLTSVRRKLSANPTCTANAWKYVKYLQESYPHWNCLKKVIPAMHGKLTFVPKNAKTDRSIVVEPMVNTFLQKGVGLYLKARLQKFGVNLKNQKRNQELARKGSLDGSLATIDLSSASDTISREVVAAILPIDWWVLLEDLRTHEVKLPDGRVIVLQKFSSMGNGFTFELESLIFFCLAKVVCPDGIVSIYGDDIIIPSTHYNVMAYALHQFGFDINPSKSFWTGKFRESCGKDYFGGIDVRPCYVEDRLSIKELFRLHNFFRREANDEVCQLILKYIPKRFRIFGPDGFGDGHLLGDHPRQIYRKNIGWSGYTFRTFQTKPYRRCEPLEGDYAAFLYSTTDRCGILQRKERRQSDDACINDAEVIASQSMYQERQVTQRYRLVRIYTLG